MVEDHQGGSHELESKALNLKSVPIPVLISGELEMCEEISVRYKCSHWERLSPTCIEEPKSINEEAERFAWLRGLPQPLLWLSSEALFGARERVKE
jgi:hypothetical protein